MKTTKYPYLGLSFIIIGLIMLVGCSTGPSAEQIANLSKTYTPEDQALASIYDRSCKACHTVAETGAPLTGDLAAWQERIDEKGNEGMLDSVINGSGGMPPFGMCMDCNAEEFTALIQFMATAQQQ